MGRIATNEITAIGSGSADAEAVKKALKAVFKSHCMHREWHMGNRGNRSDYCETISIISLQSND